MTGQRDKGSTEPSLAEYSVLGILTDGPSHGFALARELSPGSALGRILTVPRPVAYRALGRLVEAGLAEPVLVEPGQAGPQRTVHRITRRGRNRLNAWLGRPVEHIRDLRVEFQLKLALLGRMGRSPLALIESQRAAIQPALIALEQMTPGAVDHVELWRHHIAKAASAYLQHLERLYSKG